MQLIKSLPYIYYSILSFEELIQVLFDELTPSHVIPKKYYYAIQFDGKINPDGNFFLQKTIGLSGIINMSLKKSIKPLTIPAV